MNLKGCRSKVVAYLRLQTQHLPEEIEENHDNSVRIAGIWTKIRNRDLANTKEGVLISIHC
jgi:hypothetical protein